MDRRRTWATSPEGCDEASNTEGLSLEVTLGTKIERFRADGPKAPLGASIDALPTVIGSTLRTVVLSRSGRMMAARTHGSSP